MVIGNVCLAVNTENAAISVYYGNGVKCSVAGFFIKTYRENYAEFFCNFLKVRNCRILIRRCGQTIVIVIAFLTEIQVLEKFGKQYYLCTARCCLAHKAVSFLNVGCGIF